MDDKPSFTKFAVVSMIPLWDAHNRALRLYLDKGNPNPRLTYFVYSDGGEYRLIDDPQRLLAANLHTDKESTFMVFRRNDAIVYLGKRWGSDYYDLSGVDTENIADELWDFVDGRDSAN